MFQFYNHHFHRHSMGVVKTYLAKISTNLGKCTWCLCTSDWSADVDKIQHGGHHVSSSLRQRLDSPAVLDKSIVAAARALPMPSTWRSAVLINQIQHGGRHASSKEWFMHVRHCNKFWWLNSINCFYLYDRVKVTPPTLFWEVYISLNLLTYTVLYIHHIVLKGSVWRDRRGSGVFTFKRYWYGTLALEVKKNRAFAVVF